MTNQTNSMDFNAMSRDELIDYIGLEVDPETPHEDLVAMAMQKQTD